MKTLSLLPIILLGLALSIGAQESWVPQTSNATGILYSVDFVDSNIGYVDGFRKTTNGGATWTNLINNTDQWQGQDFVDANNGWVVGFNGYISKTTNGGATWTFNNNFAGSVRLNSVHFANASTGWAVGSGGRVLKTTNGGSNWTSQTFPGAAVFHSVYFVDVNTGWVVGDSGVIYKTSNGGTNWTRQSIGRTKGGWREWTSVHFVNVNTGWVVGYSDSILKTNNGGSSWTAQASPKGDTAPVSIYFINADTGWGVGGSDVILKTTNGGSTWITQFQSNSIVNTLYSVHFVDGIHGWAVGDHGTILKHTGNPTPILMCNSSHGERFESIYNGQLWYQLPAPSRISVLLFDTRGRLILKLFDAMQEAGHHSLPLPAKGSILDFQVDGLHKLVRLPE